ncbi:hypothetical protein AB0J72_25455 [Dactylosporangium sp. NPDC049742]|uniref:hypothetical protein n=1 Tax=Dactylosporangium sp. NPDC049742 TaxID=3154737 RepID=UPI0034377035
MVVVFVEGVDGTGKTTLINHLIHCHPAGVAIAASPLWRYLPAVSVPEAFAAWVTTTPATTVAVSLLSAQHMRVSDLPALTTRHAIVLVDRGPRTVEASARAHLATAEPPSAQSPAITHLTAALHTAVRHLAQAHPCLSIELAADSYDEIIERLTDPDRGNARYLRYLRTFLREFQNCAVADGPARVRLAATASLTRNTAAARQAIRAAVQRGSAR